MTRDPIATGFVLAGAFNVIGILVTTRLFTADPIGPLYPGLFGPEGCALIVIWGLAYLAAAPRWRDLPALCGVFAVEKAFYGATWIAYWLHPHTPTWATLRDEHPDAILFLTVYGAGDLVFAGLFAVAAWTALRR